jgi:hypothetical protein
MRIAKQAAPLLLLGVVLVGCGDPAPQGTLDPNLPVVMVMVDGMS